MIEAWARYLPPRLALKHPDATAPPRTAAAWDEDSFTMALEAGCRCLRLREADGAAAPIDTVLVVRSPGPGEAGDQALVEGLGLEPSSRVIGLAASADAEADALDLALTRIEAGRSATALVIGSSSPGTDGDGDGAAAIVLAGKPLRHARGRAFANLDRVWPQSDAAAVVPARFDAREVREPALQEAFGEALSYAGISASELDAWSYRGPPAARIGAALGLDAPIEAEALYAGAAGAEFLIGLVALCERGGLTASVNVGERASVFLWEGAEGPRWGKGEDVPAGEPLGFSEYKIEQRRRGEIGRQQANPMDYLREAGAILRLEGARCAACGSVSAASTTTSGRSSFEGRCEQCGSDCEPVRLARKGTVAAFTRSEMEADPTAYAVCDLDGGGRMLLELAGDARTETAIGDRVDLVLRRGPGVGAAGIYLWKAVPRG